MHFSYLSIYLLSCKVDSSSITLVYGVKRYKNQSCQILQNEAIIDNNKDNRHTNDCKHGVSGQQCWVASYPGPHIITVFPLEGLVTIVCACA